MRDNLSRLLTNFDFIAQMTKYEENQTTEAMEKEARKLAKETHKVELET
jgi:hypothetical protein